MEQSRIARRHRQDGESSSASTWAELRKLADNCAINLGQGFPDFCPVPAAIEAACESLRESVSNNQYAPMGGIDLLKNALAGMYFRDCAIPPSLQISVTSSGTEAIYAAMQSLVNPGDHVLLFEPCFPWYVSAIKLAGGTPVVVELHSPTFSLLDPRTLEDARTAVTTHPKISTS